MTLISTTRKINSSDELIWSIISDIDKDPDFWHGIKAVKNIKREGNDWTRNYYCIQKFKMPRIGNANTSKTNNNSNQRRTHHRNKDNKCNKNRHWEMRNQSGLGYSYEGINEFLHILYQKTYFKGNRWSPRKDCQKGRMIISYWLD